MKSCSIYSMCRHQTYIIIISVTFLVFACTNLFLFCFLYNNPQNAQPMLNLNWPDKIKSVLSRNFNLMQNEWRLNPSILGQATESFDLKCNSLQHAEIKAFLAFGWTKMIYHMTVNGKDVAMKCINMRGHDVSNCLSNKDESTDSCYAKAALKLINEVSRMSIFKHPNIIKLLGYCIPEKPNSNDGKSVNIITELGESINTIKLLLMSWEERLKISLELARLIYHLSNTPLGSVALNDFRRQQFVFVRGDLKLIDVDDVGIGDPVCDQHSSCCITSQNQSYCVPCDNYICTGYNEKLNILNAGKHFIKHILPHEVPPELKLHVNELNEAYETASWSSKKILRKTEDITLLYMKGLHHNVTS